MRKRLKDLLACPTCRAPLTEAEGERLACLRCGANFEQRDGVPVLLDEESRREILRFYGGRPEQEVEDRRRKAGKKAGWLDHLLTHPPSRKVGDKTVPNLQKLWRLVKQREPDPLVLTVGKLKVNINRASSQDDPDVQALEAASVRLDIKPGPGVDVVGDGHKLPYLDNSFDAAIGLTTLKHLRNPYTFVSELYRVVKPGGLVYAQCVLYDPYHRHPGDYVHFTTSGIVNLFSQFEPVETGVNTGPSYTVFKMLPYYVGCLLGGKSPTRYKMALYGSMWLLSPIRYLDHFLLDSPWKDYVAFSNYFLGRKPERADG
jgi:uncharacterized protein YbaR (Trm112 family)/SAM-dependent methyltransferase